MNKNAVASLAVDLGLGLTTEAASSALAAPVRIKVMPAGDFKAVDGRPASMAGVSAKAWLLGDAQAVLVIAAFKARKLDLVIDYEHQTLMTASNGKPAPAAGWITALEWVADDGLYAQVNWTEDGACAITEREYRYLSPVFAFDKATGAVLGLLHVGLTNTPALNTDYLPTVAGLSSLFHTSNFQQPQEISMKQVLAALKLAPDATEETTLTALSALQGQLVTKDAEIAALKASQFDPAKHMPMAEHNKVAEALVAKEGEVAALKADQDKAEHEAVMTAALTSSQIVPANEAYWRRQPLAVLKEYLLTAPKIAALTSTQSGGKPPAGGAPAVNLDADEFAMCKSMGLDPAAFAKTKADEAALAAA